MGRVGESSHHCGERGREKERRIDDSSANSYHALQVSSGSCPADHAAVATPSTSSSPLCRCTIVVQTSMQVRLGTELGIHFSRFSRQKEKGLKTKIFLLYILLSNTSLSLFKSVCLSSACLITMQLTFQSRRRGTRARTQGVPQYRLCSV